MSISGLADTSHLDVRFEGLDINDNKSMRHAMSQRNQILNIGKCSGIANGSTIEVS